MLPASARAAARCCPHPFDLTAGERAEGCLPRSGSGVRSQAANVQHHGLFGGQGEHLRQPGDEVVAVELPHRIEVLAVDRDRPQQPPPRRCLVLLRPETQKPGNVRREPGCARGWANSAAHGSVTGARLHSEKPSSRRLVLKPRRRSSRTASSACTQQGPRQNMRPIRSLCRLTKKVDGLFLLA